MNLVLSIYTKKAYKEVYLPDINNEDYNIVLSRDLFLIQEDVVLNFDVIDGVWSIYPGEQYELVFNGKQYNKIEIEDGTKFAVYLKDGNAIPITAVETDSGLEKSEKYTLVSDSITIGSSNDCDIINTSSLMTREHMRLLKTTDGWYVSDISKNGVYLNSKRVTGREKLSYGDYIFAFDLKIVFLDTVISVNVDGKNITVNPNTRRIKPIDRSNIETKSRIRNLFTKNKYYNRAPRVFRELYTETVKIEQPPAPKQAAERSFLSTIGPSFTMAIPMILGSLLMVISNRTSGASSGLFMYTGMVTAGASALLGIFWGTVNFRKAKKQSKEEEALRYEKYRDYLMLVSEEIKNQNKTNTYVLLDKYPASSVCAQYSDKDATLWSRNFNHDDFLFCRLGIGDMPFQVKIDIPQDKFSVVEDNLASIPKMIHERYSMLRNVPIGIDLYKDRLVGIVGGANKTGALELVKTLSVQLAANVCYTDVKLAYMFNDNSESSQLSFFRWLPHTWSVDKKNRLFASNKTETSDVCYELTKVFRMRDEQSNSYSGNKNSFIKPHYIIFVEDASLLEGEPLLKYISSGKSDIGVTTVLLAERYEDLPNNCEKIIVNDGRYSGIYSPQTMSNMESNINFDTVSDKEAEEFTRRVSGIEVSEINSDGEIPSSLAFLEMYGVETTEELNAIDRWRKNRTYDTMKALVGRKAGGVLCYLDLHEKYHGPHGLVAGTTGSGKSEMLQTYILSLAINFSPDDVAFLIIDFKGGGMANLFSGLPHLAGKVSNLSGNQVRRAMISIKSENIKRQRIFGEHGVNNINQYTRLLKSNDASIRIPHLFIIIDEFAELKREQPDFLNELISIAQVGRSLGIHLILATQKPAGTVDDNIRSNSKFKLCLRVQDKQDSIDMINKPDAAYIYNAGRCYLQVGNDEIFELFQSGWSGAVYDEKASGTQNQVSLITNTGRVALVGKKGNLKRRENKKKEWLSSIIECIRAVLEMHEYTLQSKGISSDELNEIVSDVFSVIAQMNLDYSESPKNFQRIKQLIAAIVELHTIDTDAIAAYAAENSIQLPEPKDVVQLDAIVNYLAREAETYGYEPPSPVWTPMLPEKLVLDDVSAYGKTNYGSNGWNDPDNSSWTLSVPIGIYDDPMNQAQKPVCMDIAENGHFAVCGGVNSGKSTALQTYVWSLISTYSPQLVNLYLLDFSNNMLQVFENAPHVGGVMFENDEEKISKFFYMIIQILNQRKKTFRGGNYSQFIKSNGYKFPSIVVVIDNYANFREKTNDKYVDAILEISRDGISCGIFLAISSAGFGMSELPNKVADNIKTTLALNMGDKQKFLDVLRISRVESVPEDVQGRGLINVDGNILEFQTALALTAVDSYMLGEEIQKRIIKMNDDYTGKRARKIPEIPEKPVWSDIVNSDGFEDKVKDVYYLPFAYNKENADIYSVDLRETFCYLISGKPRTGRTNTLKTLALSAKEKNAKICIFDNGNGMLKRFSETVGAGYLTNDEELFRYLLGFKDIILKRNKVKKAMEQNGAEDIEIFDEMAKEEPVMFFIADFPNFLKSVYNPSPSVSNMSGFLENIFANGRLYNVYFFIDVNSDDIPLLMSRRIYSLASSYKCGIHLGGNVAGQRLFDFSSLNMSYTEQSKTQKAGTGITTATDEMQCTQVVIPFAKGVV